MVTRASLLRSIRLWLAVFILGLVLSGLTAFPLRSESTTLLHIASRLHLDRSLPSLFAWLQRVHTGLDETGYRYPFLAYGTDWLAFAHLTLAIVFLGPWRDPVRNQWVTTFGLIACLGILPLALIAGPLRGIPFYWRLIDCSFGVIGSIPLWIVRRRTAALERLEASAFPSSQHFAPAVFTPAESDFSRVAKEQS